MCSAAGLALLGAFALFPIFFSHHRHPPRWPYVLFAMLSTLAFLAAAAALAVSVYLFTKVKDRFHDQRVEAAYGPSVRTYILLMIGIRFGLTACFVAYIDMVVRCSNSGPSRRRAKCRVWNLHGRQVWAAGSAPCLYLLSDDGGCRSEPQNHSSSPS